MATGLERGLSALNSLTMPQEVSSSARGWAMGAIALGGITDILKESAAHKRKLEAIKQTSKEKWAFEFAKMQKKEEYDIAKEKRDLNAALTKKTQEFELKAPEEISNLLEKQRNLMDILNTSEDEDKRRNLLKEIDYNTFMLQKMGYRTPIKKTEPESSGLWNRTKQGFGTLMDNMFGEEDEEEGTNKNLLAPRMRTNL